MEGMLLDATEAVVKIQEVALLPLFGGAINHAFQSTLVTNNTLCWPQDLLLMFRRCCVLMSCENNLLVLSRERGNELQKMVYRGQSLIPC